MFSARTARFSVRELSIVVASGAIVDTVCVDETTFFSSTGGGGVTSGADVLVDFFVGLEVLDEALVLDFLVVGLVGAVAMIVGYYTYISARVFKSFYSLINIINRGIKPR